ncbi:MAG TPA: DUF4381 domain-containing protein [Sulfuricella sp.]|nr:DUF4381 domain-containing protein [Sulfuricella sp.]
MGSVKPDWLAQLAPAHAPPAPSWWPLAPGWWGMAIILAMVIAAVTYWQRRPDNRLRRVALKELKNLETRVIDDITLARGLEHLLRRYAVARFGRDAVASLSGDCWIAFIVAHGGAAWADDTGASLLRAAYGGTAKPDRARWLAGARAFIMGRS